MKKNQSVIFSLLLLVLTASLYRVWEGRPVGFAPQLAMAIFGGAVIKDKKLAFLLPLFSMLFSDLLYQVLFWQGYTSIPGFYSGQWLNYTLIGGVTAFGFLLQNNRSALKTGLVTISGSLVFFIASNFFVWLGGGGFGRPKTSEGLLMCYADALAFYRDGGAIQGFWGNVFLGDLAFAAMLFVAYFIWEKTMGQRTALA